MGVRLPRIGLALALALAGLLGVTPALGSPPEKPTAAKTPKKKAHGKGKTAKREAPLPRPKAAPPESVGHPNAGRLEGGIRLDTGLPFLRVVPAYESGDVRWGLPSFVKMLERAARTVNKRHPGSVLDVGDLSQKNGGDLLRHHSHESGRDADIGFYVVDAKGKPVKGGPKFHKVDGDDLSVVGLPGARFDLARNWLFLQALLSDTRARVSHVFVDGRLRRALLDHGRKVGATRALLDRAAGVLMQPSDSLPHDDHFHIRISCPSTMKGVCVELSRGAPMGRVRSGSRAAVVTRSRTKRPKSVTPAAPAATAVARLAPAAPTAVKARPATPADLAEAEADADEVKDSLDEVGLVKITD
jgi:penicillin-insensitive murein endopeptidase